MGGEINTARFIMPSGFHSKFADLKSLQEQLPCLRHIFSILNPFGNSFRDDVDVIVPGNENSNQRLMNCMIRRAMNYPEAHSPSNAVICDEYSSILAVVTLSERRRSVTEGILVAVLGGGWVMSR